MVKRVLLPSELSAQAEEEQFGSFLRNRLYSNKSKKNINAKKSKFIIKPSNDITKMQAQQGGQEGKSFRKPPVIDTRKTGEPAVMDEEAPPSPRSKLRARRVANKKGDKRLKPLKKAQHDLQDVSGKYANTDPFWFIQRLQNNPASLEFVYLNRKKEVGAEPFNPYNLEIVPHSLKNPNDYYTMSNRGVVHFQNEEATFVSVNKWQREHDNYAKILQLKFFKQYRVWKAFYFMKKYVVQKRKLHAKKVLSTKLFHLSDTLHKPLKEVRKICLDMQKLELFADVPKTFELDDFETVQAEQRKKISNLISEKSERITEIVADACHRSMIKAGFGDKFHDLDSISQMDNDDKDDIYGNYNFGSNTKNQNLFDDDEPYQMSYTEKSQKRRECKKLVAFVRLIDYIITDALLVLNQQSVETILNKVTLLTEHNHGQEEVTVDEPENEDDYLETGAATEDEHLPLFRTEVRMTQDSERMIHVVPDKDNFFKMVDGVIKGFFKAIKVERLLCKKEFEEYVDPVVKDRGEEVKIGTGPNIEKIINDDIEYLDLTKHIRETLYLSCDKVLEYCHLFEPIRKIYLENERHNIDIIREMNPSLDWFRDEISKYKDQIDLIKKMPVKKHSGMFLVDSQRLKDIFTPSPRNCLNSIYDFLPVLARELNERLYLDIKDGVNKLQTPPTTVEDFVTFLSHMSVIRDNLESLEKRFDHVHEIYRLLEDEKVNVPAEDKESFNGRTVSTITTLRAALTLAEESKEDKTSKFSKDVESKFVVLRDIVNDVQEKAKHEMIADEHSNVREVIDYLTDLKDTVDQKRKRATELSGFQELFNATPDEIENAEEVSDDVELKLRLWSSLDKWDEQVQDWEETYFMHVGVDDIRTQVEKYSFVGIQVEKGLPDNPVVGKLVEMVDTWKVLLPILADLKNPYYEGRHWQKLDSILGKPLYMTMNKPPIVNADGEEDPFANQFKLSELLELDIESKAEQIEMVSQEASNEHSLVQLLATVEAHWEGIEFLIAPHKDMFIIGDTEDIVTQLEDDNMTISVILSSSFVAAIKTQVEKWEHDIKLMIETIDQWIKCQSKWLYLENVFSAPDIAKQLAEENKLFKTVNRFFKDTMKRTNENRNVLSACTQNIGLLEKFKAHNHHLVKIEKALEAYLERKRNEFPRMYFLSNDDLLDILSQTANPQAVQAHLEKMFDNIKSLEIEDDVNIRAMYSSEGERIDFQSTTLKARNNVEGWLQDVEKNMVETLRYLTKEAVKDYAVQERGVWIKEHYCQIVLTVNQIFWAKNVTECLESDNPIESLKNFYEQSVVNLNQLAALARGKLSKLERKVICTLIIIDVHARDVVEQMIEDGVSSPSHFGWQKQLRYYWDKERGDCFVRQNNSEFKYGYEYLGCKSRLVITPLTDRIYMTLTGALHLKMGGSPAGPAGTGKTETVKDLAKAMAYQCVVYNCSDGVTYKMMYKFFSGIVQTGAWACFDEFNRINVEVLSVIASQLQTIQSALKAQLTRFEFEEGKEISLRDTCGVFITMNPGYAGRTELPDNLKALFRPVACMIPDYSLISQVILYSEGYEDAKILSKKMVQLYKLSNEQLSSQDHYDFGMRAMKSVLVMAGELKRANPDRPEDETLMKAMKDSNIPKFVREDVSLFEGIVGDLFPTTKERVIINDTLVDGIHAIMERRQYDPVQKFVKKIVQLYDTMVVRHGVMLVGPTGAGKTVARNVLADTLSYLRDERGEKHETFQKIRQYCLNPKCITYGQLYGTFNLMTQEWFDGLIPHFARKAVKDLSEDRKWIIFDGPVDTLWIESMNSVLDDSKLLCLDNTERIQLNDKINFLFEVENLSEASPATVSRCGMVYMDPSELGWKPSMTSWLAKLKKSQKNIDIEYVYALVHEHVAPLLTWIRKNAQELIKTVDLNLITSFCDLFDGLLRYEKVKFENPEEVEDAQHTNEIILNNIFTFSLIWSIGGNINDEFRPIFERQLREQLGRVCTMPTFNTIYDYCIDFETNAFVQWEIPEFNYNPELPYFQILVPTVDTVRYGYFLRVLTNIEKPLLFSGDTGVGKTSIISQTLDEYQEKLGLELVAIQFSAQTSANRTQKMIESKLVSRKNVLKAPPGKKVVLFVDDLNMPQLEEFGAQPPVELIRQLVGYNGFYDIEDRETFQWREVQDTTLVTACGPPGGGRNPLSERTTRLFHCFNIPNLSDESKMRIFGSILDGFFTQGFSEDVKSVSKSVVRASIDLYNRTCEDFRPTPSCAHYTFNLRDLSKIFQGMLQVTEVSIKKSKQVAKLWAHESLRCFYDRLNNTEDREKFTDLVMELLRRYFKGSAWSDDEIFGAEPVVFNTLMVMEKEARQYEEITNFSKLPSVLDDYLGNYNVSSQLKMDLVFFPDAMFHTCRIVRILSQQRGNALLVGVGGCGKQSLTRIATSIVGYEIFEIKLKRGYALNEFREDLQKLYYTAGVEGKPVTFLFSDFQIVDESFLEDINNILNSGEVPNLFPPEEKEKCINELRPAAREAGVPETRLAIYKFFIDRVRDNLHIVLCMSPVGDSFRTRCRMFPSLVNCCTIDWFDEWPTEALQAVSERKFARIQAGEPETKKALTEMCAFVHSTMIEYVDKFEKELGRKFYVTPASYLQFIKFYHKMIDEKRSNLNLARSKLKRGLEILKKTNEDVGVMKIQLEELQPQLKAQTEKTEEILKEVSASTKEANAKRVVIAAEEKIVNEKTKKAEELKKEAEEKLNEALPALLKAQQALEGIDKGDIAEIKRYQTPPDAVEVVLNAVQVLYGEKKPTWERGVKLLSSNGFVNNCLNFNKENIPERIIKMLKKKFINHELFDEEVVRSKSGAAASLCIWVRSMVLFDDVNKKVVPLKETLKVAKKELDSMSEQLKTKQTELQSVERDVEQLNEKYNENMAALKDLQEKTQLAQKRLEAAEKLTGSLANEYKRWSESIGSFDEKMRTLPGNIFFASACVVYIGPYNAEFRKELCNIWLEKMRELEIPLSDDCSLITVLGDPVQIRDWNISGLPTDQQSIENAIIATSTDRWPLMIDPQGQAQTWIQNNEKQQGIQTIQMTQNNYLRTIDNSIRIGKPILMENLPERIDPPLDPLLQKEIQKKQGRLVIILGSSETEYNPKFKFYMSTKLSNPHYLPEVCNKVTLINFTVTLRGLEDQLLGDVVRQLKREWEEEKDKLVRSVADDSKMLKDLEDQILNSLSSVGDRNILDDEKIITTLDDSKFMAGVIANRVEKAQDTQQKINLAREDYRSVATRGSILYFVMADLAKIDPMYQYSLDYFKKIFNIVIEKQKKVEEAKNKGKSEEDEDITGLLNLLIDLITETLYLNVCRGLFEKDKHIFSFLTCCNILIHENKITKAEFEYLIRGTPTDGKQNLLDNNLTEEQWKLLVTLDAELFKNELIDIIVPNVAQFEEWASHRDPFLVELPIKQTENITFSNFHKLMLLKVFAEEKIMYASKSFVKEELGDTFTKIPPLDLSKAVADTTYEVPIIFILSQGADPVEGLIRFAKQQGYQDRLFMKSLGQGQEEGAKKLIERGMKTGDWILLQNCHLSISFMPELERIITSFKNPTRIIHQDFRLWLTSMPSKDFPIPILQNGVKLTNEPPKGIRSNLAKSWADMDNDYFTHFDDDSRFEESHCSKALAFKKLLFGLTSFHSIIQERKKFGPLGWNILYEFNDADLHVAKLWLSMFLDENNEIPWDSLKYVIGEIVYGGRVTDPWDGRLIINILYEYFTPEILKETFKIATDPLYTIPVDGPKDQFVGFVDKLPLIDTPDLFSMHENADIVFQLQESSKLLNTIILTQRGTSSSGDSNAVERVRQKVNDILERLPPILDREEAGPNTFIRMENGVMHSLSTVLSQEMEKFNLLLSTVRKSCKSLLKALDGLVVMSGELEQMNADILTNEVPQIWQDVAYPSLKKLGSWIDDLIERVAFMRNWLVNGVPKVFLISALFFPQGLMTGVLQTHARKYQIPIDTLNFSFKVLSESEDEISESPEDGIFVSGMHLDGAKWDAKKQQLIECDVGEMKSPLPLIHFLPEADHVTPPNTYVCPLYKTSVRKGVLNSMGNSTNFIVALELPMNPQLDQSHWILRGVALLCQTE